MFGRNDVKVRGKKHEKDEKHKGKISISHYPKKKKKKKNSQDKSLENLYDGWKSEGWK